MKNSFRTSPQRLGEKLIEIRNHLNLSQSEMLIKLGFQDILYRSNISQYELGRREPPLLILLRYAQLAGVSVDFLIDDNLELPSFFHNKN